ncbi:MAG: carboxymuconolactone decarboxylase family protein [Flavobacteriales bacterium]|nr:carboxymuconolactone decarboxylase family protein [Flavobacteriales bacterium]
MIKDHPEHYHQLRRLMGTMIKDMPETMKGFSALNDAALADGALSSKTKELIALGIAIYAKCDGCIAYHVHDALEAGSSRQEIEETIGVSMLMGGGPALVYACEAIEALEQFLEKGS